MAKILNSDGKPLHPSSGADRIGTTYYMVASICAENYNGEHLVWYDAESVFWVWFLFVAERVETWNDYLSAFAVHQT
jgi:hypothetical protein